MSLLTAEPFLLMKSAILIFGCRSTSSGFCRTEQLKERLVTLFVEECGVALKPMLRDMISRGTALDLIKMYFEVGVKK